MHDIVHSLVNLYRKNTIKEFINYFYALLDLAWFAG